MPKITEFKSRLAWRFVERRIDSAPISHLEDKQPVFLLLTPRAGSQHFLALLDSIPDAAFDFEILGNVSMHAARMYFDPFKKAAKKNIKVWVRRHMSDSRFLRTSFASTVFSSKSLCLAC